MIADYDTVEYTVHTGNYCPLVRDLIEDIMTFERGNYEWSVDLAPDNEVVINLGHNAHWLARAYFRVHEENGHRGKCKLAQFLKRYVKCNVGEKAWNRTNASTTFMLNGRSYSVQNAFYVYDILSDNKRGTGAYSAEYRKTMKGVQNDPLTTEMERAKREEIIKIKTRYQKLIKDHYDETDRKIDEYRNKLTAEHKIYVESMTNEMNAELKKVNDVLADGLYMLSA